MANAIPIDIDVTAVDVVPQALERAEAKARQAGVSIHFTPADVLQLPDLGKPFPFVFDRGTQPSPKASDST